MLTFTLLALSLLSAFHQSASQPKLIDDGKTRVFVTDSQSWETYGGGSASGNRNWWSGGSWMAGGARPQTAEIIKTINERCPQITVTNDRQKADFMLTLDHEGGKGALQHRNKIAVFDRNGDDIFSDSTRSLGNAVKDACQVILNAPRIKPKEEPEPSAARVVSSPAQTANTAEIDVASTPDGADVELDGKFVGNTHSTIGVAAGEHTLTINKTGFKPWERKIKVSTGKVSVLAELEPVTAKTAPSPAAETVEVSNQSTREITVNIAISSDPSGADVYADNVFVGKTPTKLNLKPGAHYLRMFAKGYQNWSRQITVGNGATNSVEASLQKTE